MEVLAWVLLYFSVGIGCVTFQQVTNGGPDSLDEVELVLGVVLWPGWILYIVVYYSVNKLTKLFRKFHR